MKKFIFILPFLASFLSFVSACGPEHEEAPHAANGLIGFGLMGNVVYGLVIITLVLTMIFLYKKINGGK